MTAIKSRSTWNTSAISTPLALSSVFMHQSANLLFWTLENVDTWLKQMLTHKDHWSMYIKPLKTDTSNVSRIHRFDCKTKELLKHYIHTMAQQWRKSCESSATTTLPSILCECYIRSEGFPLKPIAIKSHKILNGRLCWKLLV